MPCSAEVERVSRGWSRRWRREEREKGDGLLVEVLCLVEVALLVGVVALLLELVGLGVLSCVVGHGRGGEMGGGERCVERCLRGEVGWASASGVCGAGAAVQGAAEREEDERELVEADLLSTSTRVRAAISPSTQASLCTAV